MAITNTEATMANDEQQATVVVPYDEYQRRQIAESKAQAAANRKDEVDAGGRFVVDGVTYRHNERGEAVPVDDAVKAEEPKAEEPKKR
jgi:hypothetical protein